MPSTVVGSEVLRNRALNCWPWVRSFTQSPDAVIHSTGRYCGGVPHYGDGVAVAPRLDPNDAKAVLVILIGDPLDQPRQHLSIGRMGRRFHGVRPAL